MVIRLIRLKRREYFKSVANLMDLSVILLSLTYLVLSYGLLYGKEDVISCPEEMWAGILGYRKQLLLDVP